MLKLEEGGMIEPNDGTEIRCETHGYVTTWGNLDDIQRLAVEEGIDTTEDMPCLLENKS
jgi:hypothetical protein